MQSYCLSVESLSVYTYAELKALLELGQAVGAVSLHGVDPKLALGLIWWAIHDPHERLMSQN
jgi:hypothetical protein